MKHLMFAIYDQKAGAYLPPFILPAAPMATRTFADCINSEDHQFAKHPEDYYLMEVAIFDDNTAELLPHTPIKEVISGLAAKQQTNGE